jgi:formate hydrogenlyase transcriptional activator
MCPLGFFSQKRAPGIQCHGIDDLAFLGQVANQIALAVVNALAYGEISQLKDKLARENVYLESAIRSELGNSEALRAF